MITGFSEKYYLKNGVIKNCSSFKKKENEISVYEVIRVIGGIPLFFEDHLERLQNSLKILKIGNYNISTTEFLGYVKELCDTNNQYFGNIELLISKPDNNGINLLIGFISHNYPTAIDYINGVKTVLMDAERVNPNAKIKHSKTRLKSNKFLEENSAYEVLLVNTQGEITEGSRSNIFFIKDNNVYSAPLKFVLPGITRKYAIEVIKKLGIKFTEKLITKEILKTMDSAFICGTSPGILPIKFIGNIEFDVHNKILRDTIFEFNSIVKTYMNK